MAVDALVAVLAGRVYDRRGLRVLSVVPLATVGVLLAFSDSVPLVWLGAGVWGGVMGLQESTLRAAVGDMIPGHGRGMAYGVFNGLYGFALLAGSVAMGALYGVSIGWLVGFIAAVELVAALSFVPLTRSLRTGAPEAQ
jgi:hypothetical protein